MSMENLWLRQSVHGWVLFLGIKSVYSDKSERNYGGKCLGWPVTSYGGESNPVTDCFITDTFLLLLFNRCTPPSLTHCLKRTKHLENDEARIWMPTVHWATTTSFSIHLYYGSKENRRLECFRWMSLSLATGNDGAANMRDTQ